MKVNESRIFFKLTFAAFLVCICQLSYAGDYQYHKVEIRESDILTGYVVERIPLKYYAKPDIELKLITASPVSSLPDDAIPRKTGTYDVILGKERKKPFALVRIPAYTQLEDGKLMQITSLTIVVKENEPAEIAEGGRAASKTTAGASPLATGSWHKISVSKTGFYKVDHTFLTKMGISGINSSDIRLFGKGGKMLPEKNSTENIKGLTETAIQVFDGGDGSFDAGDYFIFYAQGPVSWEEVAGVPGLIGNKNYYIDKGYYFLNFDGGAGKRVETQASVPISNISVNSYTGLAFHEEDWSNPQLFGKNWWGEEFSNAPGKQASHSINVNLGNTFDSALINIHLVNTAQAEANFSVTMNGQYLGDVSIGPTNNYEYAPRALGELLTARLPVNGTANFNINYSSTSSDGSGWLDYISVNTRKPLAMEANSIIFTDLNSVAAGNVAQYTLSGANGNTQVWDVTDPHNPVRMKGSLNGSNYEFVQDASSMRWYAAVNNSTSLDVPEYVGAVANQNLYGSPQMDYLIITYPDFKPAAERLADFHRKSGMRVIVATTTQVYNEFSSGGQDIGAIRDFARMFYQRAGMSVAEMPKYMLLLGDASYDYKDRVSSNTNFVPTFEAEESFNYLSSFSTDDYYGFLDDNEAIERYDIPNTLDIGVGRIPAKSLTEANQVIDKILYYKSPATLGDWRLNTIYVADNEDGAGAHMSDAENINNIVQDNSSIHNATKVYEDAIQMISTPGGARAPEANKAINDGIFKGAFLVNYTGHGNTQVLSHERILTKDDYNKWRNLDALPFMVTATCDFGQFDQPSFVSAGEELALKANGGVIATLTTTHLVYAQANALLNTEFISAQFQHVGGKWNTFGDAMRIGKNVTYTVDFSNVNTIVNFRKFALLGDPALVPNFPEYFIQTESITDGATGKVTDTISALGEYIVKGKVTDVNGNILSDFNGELSVTIFDKPRTVKTITSIDKTFEVRNNTIYKGKATVNNGEFSFAFIAPKDINYDFGLGRGSFYAHNGITDAAGRDSTITVGGYSDNPRIEDNPPIVRPYIKDSLFRDGGLTGTNTALFAILEDETGINVSGNSVGHDLTAILDGDVSSPYIMNDYYETAPNTYKRGYVYFPIEGIPDGRHTLTVKAWDVNNNSGEGSVNFIVKDGEIVELWELGNYPNPFRDKTNFIFEHNHPDEDLTAEINIYNTSGVFVRKIKQDFVTSGSHSIEMSWDGTDNNGVKLPAGVYIYKMQISTSEGIQNTAYQKLVIVR